MDRGSTCVTKWASASRHSPCMPARARVLEAGRRFLISAVVYRLCSDQLIAKEESRINKLRTDCAKFTTTMQPVFNQKDDILNHAQYRNVPAAIKKRFTASLKAVEDMLKQAVNVTSRRSTAPLSFSSEDVRTAAKELQVGDRKLGTTITTLATSPLCALLLGGQLWGRSPLWWWWSPSPRPRSGRRQHHDQPPEHARGCVGVVVVLESISYGNRARGRPALP